MPGADKTQTWSPSTDSSSSSGSASGQPRDTQPAAPRTVSFSSEPSASEVSAIAAAFASAEASPVPQASMSTADTLSPALKTSPGELVGSTLKHFRIERRIAAGGMGEVYLGYDTSLSRPVAIKTIRSELVRDRSFLARFVREATAQANVVHPHVVQVYYVGEDRGVWFLAMQIVDGGSLHDVLAKRKTMRWQDAAKQMTAICEGLCVAERLGIVHRDIKPANILLDKDGRALLSDFGLAASAGAVDDVAAPKKESNAGPSGSQLQLATVTQVGVVMGTPEYVAPEQLRVGPLDARADVYALGATFFHLVSGQAAMPVVTLAEAITKYASGFRAQRLQEVAPHVPRRFARVIDKCLEVQPELRYPTMAALLEALRRAGPQPEVPASPLLRALVWMIDVAPFLVIALETYSMMPWLGPALFFIAGLVGMAALGSTPGIWMMRLRLRTSDDGDVSLARGFARFLIQHGWYVPLVVGGAALYGSSDLDVLLIVSAVWLVLILLGSIGALFGRHQTLHDLITKTRVLVDVRYR